MKRMLKVVEIILAVAYVVSNFMFALVEKTAVMLNVYLLLALSFVFVYLICHLTKNKKGHDYCVSIFLVAIIACAFIMYPQINNASQDMTHTLDVDN